MRERQREGALERQDLEAIGRAARRLADELGLRLVVLFGSTARGEECPEDLDLALLAAGREAVDVIRATNLLTVLLGRQDVDVVDLAHAEPVLMMLVARDGIPVFESAPGEFASFYSLAARRFADTRKFRDAERDWIRESAERRARR